MTRPESATAEVARGGDPPAGSRGPETLTVGELARKLRRSLDTAFPTGVWVEGEIDGLTRARSGHVYFNLVERPAGTLATAPVPARNAARSDVERPAHAPGTAPGNRADPGEGVVERPAHAPGTAPAASVSVVLFNDDRQRVNNMIRRYGNAMRMADGVGVRIQAMVDFYAPRGQLQLRMTSIDPAHTLGAIAAHRAAVVAKLAQEGLLRRNAGSEMAAVPLRVGLVTSLGSAAHADLLKVFGASGFAFTLTEVDTAVQGAGAPMAIAAAIATAAARADVVVLARGGGSTTDLAAFDQEAVARAIAGCARPVLTGIGHETDRSAADEVAHTACATPTSAARAVVQRVETWLARLQETALAIENRGRGGAGAASHSIDLTTERVARAAVAATGRAEVNLVWAVRRLTRAGQVAAARAEARVTAGTQRLKREGRAAVERAGSTVASRGRRLARASWNASRQSQGRLDRASTGVALACRLGLGVAAGRLDATEARVAALDPAAVLRRGWSLTRRGDGALVRSIHDVGAGEVITTQLGDGALASSVLSRQDQRHGKPVDEHERTPTRTAHRDAR